jgi:ribosomal protein L13
MRHYYGELTGRWYVVNEAGEVLARLATEADCHHFMRH